MNNTILQGNNSSWYYLLNTDAAIIDLIQSSISLIITFCIFFKVFDFSSFRKSIREKREKQKKEKEKKEFERIKMLISSLQNNEDVSSLKMTDDSEHFQIRLSEISLAESLSGISNHLVSRYQFQYTV